MSKEMFIVRRLVLIAICASIIIVGKLIFLSIPNIEIVTFFLIIFAIIFSFKEACAIALIYTIVEIFLFTFSEQFYIWTFIVIVTSLVKKVFRENFQLWALYSGFFGLIFGTLSAIPFFLFYEYFSQNLPKETGRLTILAYIINGLPFDAIHMVGNYFIMLFLGKTVYNLFKKLTKQYFIENGD